MKTFGVPNLPFDLNPALARSNSLKYWKKAVSCCSCLANFDLSRMVELITHDIDKAH